MVDFENRRTYSDFSAEERQMIVSEYLEGGISKQALWYKHSGYPKEHGEIVKMLREFGHRPRAFERKPRIHPPKEPIMIRNQSNEEELVHRSPDKQIRDLEQRLQAAEVKVALYETMIEIAEERFKIEIKKKSDTRRSGK